MTFNSLVIKNFFRNISNYFLYIFSLVVSVTLFYSFVLISQNQHTLATIENTSGGDQAFTAGIVVILAIIITFVMFANSIFIKRRSKELGLYKLIGMEDNRIIRILLLENAIIYFSSMVIGVVVGLLVSRLLNMILFKVMEIEAVVQFQFNIESIVITGLLFVFIFVLLLVQNYIFIKSKKLITLLKLEGISEASNIKRPGAFAMILGVFGLVMIAVGYYLADNLFEWGMNIPGVLLPLMLIILFLTIVGAYLFFRFSVALLFNIYRLSKNGQLSVTNVLSSTSIMFKMKGNAFLLTLVTTVTAVSLTAMSLSYIAYYSIDETIDNNLPYDYFFSDEEEMENAIQYLNDENIEHEVIQYEMVRKHMAVVFDGQELPEDPYYSAMTYIVSLVSDKYFDEYDLKDNEAVFVGNPMPLETVFQELDSKEFYIIQENYNQELNVIGELNRTLAPVPIAYTLYSFIVSDEHYEELLENDGFSMNEVFVMNGINVNNDNAQISNDIIELNRGDGFLISKYQDGHGIKEVMGLVVFIMAFIGLTFLVASGNILYFKQIGECEDEKGNYKILRKLGFNESEITNGLAVKMIYTFGIPLLIGMMHSIFAVRAGWVMFGNQVLVPFITVAIIYTVLYSIFALISWMYYRRVVQKSL